MAAQGGMQGKYDEAMRTGLGKPEQIRQQMEATRQQMAGGNMLPRERRLMQTQMDALKQRLSAGGVGAGSKADEIASKMRMAGMEVTPYQGGGGGGTALAGGGGNGGGLGEWSNMLGHRPGGLHPEALNPYDGRRGDPWEATIPRGF